MLEPGAEIGTGETNERRHEPCRRGFLFGGVAVGSFILTLVAIPLWDRMPSRDELARMLPQLPRVTSLLDSPTGRGILGLPTGEAVTVDYQRVQEALRGGGPTGGLFPPVGTPIPSPTFPRQWVGPAGVQRNR